MTQVAERHDTLSAAFDAFRSRPTFGSAALAAARAAAFDRFLERGFPTTRDEEWRHTNISPLTRAGFSPAPADVPTNGSVSLDALAPWLLDGANVHRLVMVNGRFSHALSSTGRLPGGVTVRTLRDGHPSHQRALRGGVFVDLNTAFFEDAIVIDIAPHAIVEEPLHVLVVSLPPRGEAASGTAVEMYCPRIVVNAGEQSQVSIVESYGGTGTAFANAVTDVTLGPGAVVQHVKFQRESDAAFHLATMFVHLARAANFRSHSIALGGRLTRNDVVSVLDGEGAECTLNGLYVAAGDSLIDNHTTIDHARAHCPSHELYKGILAGHARAVFNGKIVVRPDAQKTDAKQTNKALLLTDDAQINTKPQLEIFADDVKCTHGAAIGQIDEDAMFYLRARGIGALQARNLLIHAFAGDVLNGVSVPAVREAAMHVVEQKLAI